ncbi:hypothetical protein ILUMI_08396 [Ignelater luminosus]|uniref:Beta-mannosidase Ig-fold domain-containing protein n=1 Tax=Ignelater luminosus TaxID=2038154 RepID=A0A8K0GAN8_IGNLU|nr:hypothetical protein ILUMI_08396 [Ignelater luminosus]
MSQNVKTLNLDYDSSCYGKEDTIQNCFILFTLQNNSNQQVAPDNYIFPVKLKKAKILKPTVTISTVRQNDASGRHFIIEIKSTTIALFVWLDTNGISGHFSDNGFMQVTPIKHVQFYADQSTTPEDLYNYLTVTHLSDDEYM